MEPYETHEPDEATRRAHDIVSRFEHGELSAQVTLMELLIALEDTSAVEEVLCTRPHDDLLALWAQNREACVAMVSALREQSSVPEGEIAAVEHVRRLFDKLVGESEESSVAMYSLGNPAILAEATEELIAFLHTQSLLPPDAQVLDLGCGIGRVTGELARDVRAVHGVDVSPAMIDVARRRCKSSSNAHFSVSSGTDLREVASASHTLVLAIDSFPYVVDAGEALVERMFAEVSRVLSTGGHFVIFNFSYREEEEHDVADVRALAERHGFHVQSAGSTPLKLWNGRFFRLEKTEPAKSAD